MGHGLVHRILCTLYWRRVLARGSNSFREPPSVNTSDNCLGINGRQEGYTPYLIRAWWLKISGVSYNHSQDTSPATDRWAISTTKCSPAGHICITHVLWPGRFVPTITVHANEIFRDLVSRAWCSPKPRASAQEDPMRQRDFSNTKDRRSF